jgi:hypothetical protein
VLFFEVIEAYLLRQELLKRSSFLALFPSVMVITGPSMIS